MNPHRQPSWKLALALSAAACLPLAAAPGDQKPKQPLRKAPEAQTERDSRPERPAPAAESRTELRTWLGVATAPVPSVLRDHLELAEGFGVQVDYVAEGSPAAKADLRPHDILTKLDDQLLTTPEHLATLVRSKKQGDKITLTLIRKGAEETVDATLGENELPVQAEWPQSFGFHGQSPAPPHMNVEEWNRHLQESQNRIREWMERGSAPQEPRPVRPPQKKDDHPDAKPPLPLPHHDEKPKPTATHPSGGNEKPPALSVRPGFPIEVFSGAGLIRIDNAEGEVSIQVKDGEHSIKIVNADGETVYEGDYDPEKGADALPEEARKQLKVMKLDDLKLLGVPKPGTVESRSETKTEIKIEIGNGVEKPQPKQNQNQERPL
jgi:hypothetical protein